MFGKVLVDIHCPEWTPQAACHETLLGIVASIHMVWMLVFWVYVKDGCASLHLKEESWSAQHGAHPEEWTPQAACHETLLGIVASIHMVWMLVFWVYVKDGCASLHLKEESWSAQSGLLRQPAMKHYWV